MQSLQKLSTSTQANKRFGGCSLQGQTQLPAFREPPKTLRDMLCGISPHSSSFKKNIPFASLRVKVDLAVINAPGPYCFRINGDLHHLSGALLPEQGESESYAQIYIHNPAVQLDMRQRRIVWKDISYGTYDRISEERPYPYASFNLFGSSL